MPEVVKLEKVDKFYESGSLKTQVLFDINLSFKEGSFNSVIGASGSGKSTLLNMIGTLDRPTKGLVFIDGKKTNKMSKNELADLRNATIGFVFQFHYLLPEFTALENVMMPYWIKHSAMPQEVRTRAEELMDMMGLSKVKGNLATRMSGGQQQRTAIARALCNNPKIVLADEPTGNLDSESREKVYKSFRQINEELGTTFIIVTHDRRIAEQTDRIVEISDGRIIADILK